MDIVSKLIENGFNYTNIRILIIDKELFSLLSFHQKWSAMIDSIFNDEKKMIADDLFLIIISCR